LENVINYLSNFKFSDEEIEWLRSNQIFKHADDGFFDYLSNIRFTGDIWALPEGTPFFANEPILRVEAPIIEAQLIETYLLSTVNFQTLIASKSSRVVNSARGRMVIDFGTRRAHGPEAGILAARASYIAGCAGTSNVYAGMRLGIPVYGTAAHSYTMAFESEEDSFNNYCQTFPDSTALLIDTYNTIEAAKKVSTMNFEGIKAVRLDSGNIARLSKRVRSILDNAGRDSVKIIASGDLNEYKIDRLLGSSSPIDMFGVGTEMVTSRDDPALSGIYKLVQIKKEDGIYYKAKFSPKKVTYPAAKQIFRKLQKNGKYAYDIVACHDEEPPAGCIILMRKYIDSGSLIAKLPAISEIREQCLRNVSLLPAPCKKISTRKAIYPVKYSRKLKKLLKQCKG
jgi:nicotinate phosphoribosyltransferase